MASRGSRVGLLEPSAAKMKSGPRMPRSRYRRAAAAVGSSDGPATRNATGMGWVARGDELFERAADRLDLDGDAGRLEPAHADVDERPARQPGAAERRPHREPRLQPIGEPRIEPADGAAQDQGAGGDAEDAGGEE